MKNLEKLKVPELLGKTEYEAIDALTKEQRTDVQKKLAYVTHIITAFPQGADGEPTPSGGCPCGGCYKRDEQMRDAIAALAAVVDEHGYAIVRYYCAGDELLPALLTVYLNLPEMSNPRKKTKAAA